MTMEIGSYNDRECILTDGVFYPHRKPWRRRLHLHEDIDDAVFVGIEIFPPKVPIHNRMTVTRKIWSKSIRQYITAKGDPLEGIYTAYSPFEAFKLNRRK